MGKKMRKLLAMVLVLMLMSSDLAVVAEALATLKLPSALQIIEEEAFAGNTSIEKVIVPDGTTEIRSRAFADSSMTELELPDSLTFIAEDAFEGCGEFALTVPENCYAYDRCVELGLIKLDEPDPSVIESAHPYPDEFDYTWIYDAGEGTESVTITFSAETETEEGYDFIYLYKLNDVQVGQYSGTQLAGQSVTIDGTGFKLRLVSDEAWGANEYYGFKLDSIVSKKAVPLSFDSISAESSAVNAGETVRWTVVTTGGKVPVYYDYTVLLGEEEVANGTVEAPNVIEYTPVRAGKYKLSVIARDSADVVLPAQVSDAVTVAPSTAYPESAHPYAVNTDQSWVYAAEENVESLTVTFSEETKTQSNYDYIWIYDQYGMQIGKYSGTQLAGQAIEIMGSAFTIRLTSNGSTQYHGFTITNIEKYIPGPLSFVSLTVDKAKAKTGELITWTMETEGGSRPVTYEYTVTLNGEIKYSGSVTRPEQITYVPMDAGDYTMSVVAKDAEGNELPAQTSQIRITQREVTSEEYFTYEAINGLYARITGYTGTDTGVIVPETIGEYTVQEIGAGAFRDNTTLVSVSLPDTVTTVAANAFCNCDALVGMDLGQGVTSVGNYAFYDCDALKSIAFPESVITMGQSVLRDCAKLNHVDYPKNWINSSSTGYVFADCPNLTQIDIPVGTVSIPNYAFANCTNLKKITLPEGLEYVYAYAFSKCTGLTEMIYPSTIKTLGGLDGCIGISQITIPDGTEIIGTNAFTRVPLSSISVPESVIEIKAEAFKDCNSLTNIVFSDGLEIIGTNAFSGCTNLAAALLPDSVIWIDERAFKNCSQMTSFNYPKSWSRVQHNDISVYDFDGYIFEGCVALKSITIPEGVTTIPSAAFNGATYLKEVHLPSTLKEIKAYAFRECTGIKEIDFPNGLETLGMSAFEGCTNLEAAILPDSVTWINEGVFRNCVKMSTFKYPKSWSRVQQYDQALYDFDGYIFEGCVALENITVPEGVTIIPGAAFNGATYLKEVHLPSTLKEIKAYAFRECTGIKEIDFPNGLETLGMSAFEGCTNLEAAVLPDSVTWISEGAFRNCIKMTAFNYPKSWSRVQQYDISLYDFDGYIFEGCVALKSITVPEGVTAIPGAAFNGATYLKEVQLPSTLKEIEAYAFRECTGLSKIYLSPNITTIGTDAFESCDSLTIHCEWGSYALQYAIDNSIPYYYLSLTGASIPSGTLYKGDPFELYGYVRASVNVSSVTATLYNFDKSKVLQTVTVEPGVANFNLNGYVNSSIKFGGLDLGSYAYTLVANAGDEQEILIDSRFTIVPAPLRVSKSNLVIPSGLASFDGGLGMSGTIRSNYPISEVKISLLYQEQEFKSYTAYPNAYNYNLDSLNNVFDLTQIPDTNLAVRIVVKSNGQSRLICESDFLKGDFEGDISDETYQATIQFAMGDDATGFFGQDCVNTVLGEMDTDKVMLMALNSRTDWFYGQVASIFNGGNNTYLVELYEKEICDTLLAMSEYPDLISSATDVEKDMQFYIMGLVKTGSLFLGDELKALDATGFFSEETLSTMKGWDNALKTVKDAEKLLKWTDETARGALTVLFSQENALRILDSIEAASPNSGNKEYQTAMERIRAKYTSQTNMKLLAILDIVGDEVLSDNVDEILTALIELGADWGTSYGHLTGGSLYSLANLAIDVGLTLSGAGDVADVYEEFLIQAESYTMAIQAYSDALSAVRYDKDTSNAAVNKLKICFDYAQACGIRIHETILEVDDISTDTYVKTQKYLEKLRTYRIQ